MTRFPARLLATAATAALLTSPAVAQNMLDGDVTFELGHNVGKSRNFKHIATSLGTTFDNGIGMQLDISVGKYEAINSTVPSAGVHVFYAPTSDWAVGGFVLAEDLRPGNYAYAGLEAAYTTGDFSGEVYVAYRHDYNGAFHGERYGIELAYAPGNWNGFGVFGGAHGETGLPGGTKSIAYVGADYRFANNTKLALTVGRNDRRETVATLGYTIQFGNGARFSRRHSQGVFDGY
ncbi:hypothetical protein [Pseudooceanicola sp. MF1-13]|uniref:hypothetical protein n=1 Tax=Pseudooceanicola sp. MF1-13 TaxID=3379095 RepID=UPI003891561B